MRFAMCNEMFADRPWEEMCRFLSDLGYTGLEVAPFTLAERAGDVSPQRRQELRDSSAKHGLEILGLHWLLVKPPGLYLTSPDPNIRRITAAYFNDLVNLCADLGGKIMVIGSPKQRNLLEGVTLKQAMHYAAETFKPCLDLAAQRNVILAFEPLGPQETNFIQTVGQAIELMDLVAHPNFQLNLDVKAMSSESKPIAQVIHQAKGKIAHVQVNDPNLLGPGMGEVRYEPILAALRQVGYDGWLSVEAFDYKPGVDQIARESIEYLKKVID